ncbi:helix-turn-helix domain-containing protein [Streptomyces jumonjinensis]|uniref:helix-turn-helix domain-containing protein n=1 Tax=Streptomyces jumonjinensis TaxID=1945 RepID=UPI003316C02E
MSAVAAEAAVVVPSARPSVDGDVGVVLPALFVPEASQWLSASSGRIALDGYSWLQAVHWVAGSGVYQPRRHRAHGPRSFGPTTVRIAQELAQLFPCRPGIAYLVRRTGLSERSVEYHLGMLREAGLLAYVARGTRVSGGPAQASEFARMIPEAFDAALGIRTVLRDEAAPAYTRAATGIGETGRELMARLAKKAARKVRKRRAKSSSKAPAKGGRKGPEQGAVTPVSAELHCTPMQVGTSTVSTTGSPTLPPEKELANGKKPSPTPQQQKPKRRALNRIGRRYRLAAELTATVPWLRGASTPRIAWVIRDVADAGWTATDVRAFLALAEVPAARRPSGMLAHRLKGAHQLWSTKAQRAAGVEAWHHAEETARKNRIETLREQRSAETRTGTPTSARAQRSLRTAIGAVDDLLTGDGDIAVTQLGDEIALEALTRDQVLAERAAAEHDPNLVHAALASGMTEHDARRLYTNRLVDKALRTPHQTSF